MKRKLFILSFFGLMLLNSFCGCSQDTTQQYIRKYCGLATMMMDEYGIPASVILSIAYIESGGGNSRNCKLLHNHFGIKAVKRYKIPGTKHLTAYKTYNSDSLSYKGFCEYISKKSYYPILQCNADYALWIKQSGNSGYARANKSWKHNVLGTIKKFNLSGFDLSLSPWLQHPIPVVPLK